MAEISAESTARVVIRKAPSELLLWVIPVVLALLFSLWALRGVSSSSIADDDAPRHALNGAFVFDLVRHAKVAHPVQFGFWYYSRLPALSLPYHPPVFPAFEALIYSLAGVNEFAARMAVAIATFAAVMLLYRLVLRSHSSPALALIVTVSFFVLPRIQRLSATVMLEVPALVFVLAALFFVTPEDDAFLTPRSLCFAFFAAAAIWTKQTVFLFVLPFVYVIVSAKWGLLRTPRFWMTTFLIAASAVGLALLGRELNWNSINQSWAKLGALQQVLQNSAYYLRWRIVLGLILIALSPLTYRLRGGREDYLKDRLYIAWFVAVTLILLVSPAYSYRYLFFGFAPFLVLFYSGLFRISRRFAPQYTWVAPAAVCCAIFGYGLTVRPYELHGPSEAAKVLHDAGHRRILFCGASANGAFIFAIRRYDPAFNTIVVRGDKLAANTFTPEQLSNLIQRYGLDSVVLEHSSYVQPWDALSAESLPFLSPESVVSVSDTDHTHDATLFLYRVKDPTTVPESSLRVPISVLGRDVDLRF